MVSPQILTIVLSRICSLDFDMNIANEGFSLLYISWIYNLSPHKGVEMQTMCIVQQ